MDERTMWEDLGIKNPNCGCSSEIIGVGDVSDVQIVCPKPNTLSNYNKLTNKPKINGVELVGDKTSEDLKIDTADLNYVHNQTEASDIWVVVHNLNKYPSVSIIDSAGEEVEGNVHYDSLNQVTVTFKGSFKGTATLN